MSCVINEMKFMGCDVVDFSASAGWNSQLTEVTITTAGCPDCTIPNVVGSLHTFTAEGFSFTGLLQSWNKSSDSSGNPIYVYKLVSPHPILDYTQVIVAEYQGGVQGVGNIANVYGFMESMGGNCAPVVFDNTEFGAPAGGFGFANSTGRGMPWPKVKMGLQALLGSGGGSSFCAGFGFGGVACTLDISSLPLTSMSYRIAGPTLSLSDLINQICEDGGCDWYAHFIGHTIKISVISRSEAPVLGVISDFVSGNTKIRSSIGRELRAETHSAMIAGGQKRQYYPCTDKTRMTHFWGWDADGKLIQAQHIGGELGWQVNLDFRKINIALTNKFPTDFCIVGENELRAAMGNYESFLANVGSQAKAGEDCGDSDSCLAKYLTCTLGVKAPIKDVNLDNAVDHVGCTVEADISGEVDNSKVRDAKIIHTWLQSYASDFYGKQFLVSFPLDTVICRAEDPETKQILYSDQVSTEGAWPVSDDILGLELGTDESDLFRDDSGKAQPLIKFKVEDINTKVLSVGDFISDDDYIWVKASVDADWVFGSPLGDPPNTMVCALLQLSAPLVDKKNELGALESNSVVDVFEMNGELVLSPSVSSASDKLGAQAETVRSLGPPAATEPEAIGVPMKSNVNTYGPWWALAGINPGCTRFDIDEGLVPWEYGGPTYMNLAGKAKVDGAVTYQYSADRGSVTVPGLPTLNLGSNLMSAGGGGGDGGSSSQTHSMGGEVFSFPTFSNTMHAGAVISNIQVTVGAGGVTTTYEVTSFTPVYGRFSKNNASRLKQIGMNRLRANREMRARDSLTRLLKGGKATAGGGGSSNIVRETSTDIGKGNIAPNGAPIFAAGTINASADELVRTTVLFPTKETLPFYKNFDNTAIMTLDGFFRPVESYGAPTNLPEVNDTYNVCGGAIPNQSSGPPGPGIYAISGEELSEYVPLPIRQIHLDFLTDKENHTDWTDAGNFEDRWTLQNVNSGHDVEGVGRKTCSTVWDSDPEQAGRVCLQRDESGNNPDYAEHYRFMALRGPLVVQGWGYDLAGKPIPNSESDAAPNFKNDYVGLTDKFAEDYLQKSEKWPVAPVDLRFDRKRGVWTVPPAYRMFQVQASGEIGAGSLGNANILANIDDLYDGEGDEIDNPTLKLRNWTTSTLASGTRALAYYDTASCEYWVVSSASGSSGNMRVAYSGCDQDGEIPCYDLTGCMVFSTGIEFTQWNIDTDSAEINGPDLRITGPSIGLNASSCTGEVIALTPFDSLTFGSGFHLVSGVNGGGECDWTLNSCASGTTKVAYSGCVEEDETGCYDLTGCMVFSTGIGFTQWNRDMNLPEVDGPDIRITGPSIGLNASSCTGEVIALTPFDSLTFGSGFQLVSGVDGGGECDWTLNSCASGTTKVAYSGCVEEDETGCYDLTGCMVFSTGIGFTQWNRDMNLPEVDGPDLRITGPSIGLNASSCTGEVIALTPFDSLTFGSGFHLVSGVDGGGECDWTLNSCASKVAYSGCTGEFIGEFDTGCYNLTGCMVFSTGIGFTQWNRDMNLPEVDGPDLRITGPSIGLNASSCTGEVIALTPFDSLTFGSGFQLVSGVDGGGECDWTLNSCASSGATKVAYYGCAEEEACYDLTGCMVFSKGIGFMQWNKETTSYEADGPDLRITGPSIGLNANSCNGGTIPLTPFDSLTFGSGLQLVSEDSCNWILNSCASSTASSGTLTVGYSGCEEYEELFDHDCYDLTGCMVFSTGIGFTQWNRDTNLPEVDGPDLLITGPSIGLNASSCTGEVIESTPFDVLTFGSGMHLQRESEESCNWTASSCTVGYSGLIPIVTSICCSGDNLSIEYSGLSVSDGLIKSVIGGEDVIPDCTTILC